MTDNEEFDDQEISILFDDARMKIVKVQGDFKKQKKQIVIDLAKSLEGKIPEDSISVEIVNQLSGYVYERFVRECLPQKYKQKHRVENAKKQKKKNNIEEEKLAVLLPLEPQKEVKNQDKQVVVIDAVGRSLTSQKDEDTEQFAKPVDNYSTTTFADKAFTEGSNDLQKEQKQQKQQQKIEKAQEQEIKKQIDSNNKLECPQFRNCSYYWEKCYENIELKEALEQATIFKTANQLAPSLPLSSAFSNDNIDNSKDILSFEFSRSYRELRIPLADIFKKTGDNGKVWLNGKINIKTKEIIAFNFGRLNHQPQYNDIINSNIGDGTSE